MSNVAIIDADGENICSYGFCGYSNMKQEGYKRKTNWLKKRFSEGLRFKLLQVDGKETAGFIEYIPGEYAWRPIEAPGYLVIHCIMIHGKKYKGKGYGTLLLQECLRDAKSVKSRGVAVVTSKGTWMVGSELFLAHGFEVVDTAPPGYELLVKKMGRGPLPRFKTDWDKRLRRYGAGLTLIRSDQCPCIAKFGREILHRAEMLGLPTRVIELKTARQAQSVPSAYGVFNIVYGGRVIADHPISKTRFNRIMTTVLK